MIEKECGCVVEYGYCCEIALLKSIHDLKEEVEELEEELVSLRSAFKERGKMIVDMISNNIDDYSKFSPYLESIRRLYEKEKIEMEQQNSYHIGILQKEKANLIDSNQLLRADVRRLEKTLKSVTEDNMRLRFPVKECEDDGDIHRREGMKYGGSVINFRGKQYVAHPDHPLRELKPDGSLEVVEFISFKNKEELRDFNVESFYKAAMSRLGEDE